MHVLHVMGARPNFMKLAPVVRALGGRRGVRQTVVHTGQHYDSEMSAVFFEELELPRPDINLGVGAGSHAEQTAGVMHRLEPVLLETRPDLVLVYGDVNSTLAGALVAAKLLIPVGHVEAGLRSFDRSMPEELNRRLTDAVADLLFTPSRDADENLARGGIPASRIRFVGNVMIDTLVRFLPRVERPPEAADLSRYVFVTLHRPLLFAVHPRTRQRIEELGWAARSNGVRLLPPLPDRQCLALQRSASAVITDSGGIQEETTFRGVPCLTLRENTERPVTVSEGTNTLVGRRPERLPAAVRAILDGGPKPARVPFLWDGRAGERIADALESWWGSRA